MERKRTASKGGPETVAKLKRKDTTGKEDKTTAIVAKALGIPLSLIPKETSTVLQKGHDYHGNFQIVKGTHEGTEDEWEAEIGAIIGASVDKLEDIQKKLPDSPAQLKRREQRFQICTADVNFTRDEQRAVVSKLLGTINTENHVHVRQAALAILALLKNAAREFDPETLKSISDSIASAQRRFQQDDFLQVVDVQITSVMESLVRIPDSTKGFEYPPFQKGLPFFPDHAYQVTIKLARRNVHERCAKSLLQLVHSVDATCRSISDKANADHPPESGMMVNYADFNVGFQPTVWKQICKATGKPIFQPLEEAIDLLKPGTNFVQQSNRLTYSEGDMWFYLKAEERQYCQKVLEKQTGVVYEIHCKDCSEVYVGETKRTLKVRLSEHKQAVKRGDPKNGIAVHVHKTNHCINWDGATVQRRAEGFWQRRTVEAIQIKKATLNMNLDSGLLLPMVIEDPCAPWASHFEKPILVTEAYKKNDGKVLGGLVLDGIGSAVDAMSLSRDVIVVGVPSESGQSCDGATFAFTQFFQLDHEALDDSSQPDKEQMVGRDIHGETLPRLQERAHVKRARVISKEDGTNFEFLRQALPYAPESGVHGPQEKGQFFVAFGKSVARFFDILRNLYGQPESAFVKDRMLTYATGKFGCFLYCPSAAELELQPLSHDELYPPIPFWMEFKSANPLLFYNHIQYLYTMTTNQYAGKDPPTKRVLYLMSTIFARWHSTWYHKFDVPRLPHMSTFLSKEEAHIMEQPIQIRKGYSYRKMLGEVLTSNSAPPGHTAYGTSENFGTYRLDPKELIVGVTERLSFGSGKEVMPYLKEEEMSLSWSLGLTEAGNMGHIVPDHEIMLTKGVSGILKVLKYKQGESGLTSDQTTFLRAAEYAYEGVQLYLLKFAYLALKTGQTLDPNSTAASDRKNLQDVAQRLLKLAEYDGEGDLTFHDAVQMIFSMHCCLHLVGQAVSVGRLDQLLIGYYQTDIKKKRITPERAQEIIDCFFMKFDEHAVLNRYNIPYGHSTYGSTAVTGRGGPFPTGDSLNQWIQQVTVGGYTREGAEGYNDITLMCLKACRRLPLNAPCVSLRLTTNPPPRIVEEAAKALLSGGAHPVLYNDDQMVTGLHKVLCSSYDNLSLPRPPNLLEDARDYSADGCYEPMFTGKSEFKFAYINVLKAVMYALNSGGDYQAAGPLHLAGDASSWRTPLAKDIRTFEQFQDIFLTHLRLLVGNLFGAILSAYGNPWKICPSPMLSCLLANCLERATDMTNGGSKFHILVPMYTGFANAVNSLYNVKKMVFDDVNNVATLETLKMALINNWGHSMCEPFFDTTGYGVIQTDISKQKFLELREYALQLPKFGTDTANDELNELAVWLAKEMDSITHDVLYKGPLSKTYEELRGKFGTKDHPFVFQVMTGSGTFESYVSLGSSAGATPDGRLGGQPLASDCSPQPFPQDKPVPHIPPEKQLDIIDALKPYIRLSKFIPNGCEVDIRIPESFPQESLEEFILAFAKSETGANLVSVTCADNWTYEQSYSHFQQFDLIRNRMGGWSNFFVAMFTEHQKQQQRRPLYRPHKEC